MNCPVVCKSFFVFCQQLNIYTTWQPSALTFSNHPLSVPMSVLLLSNWTHTKSFMVLHPKNQQHEKILCHLDTFDNGLTFLIFLFSITPHTSRHCIHIKDKSYIIFTSKLHHIVQTFHLNYDFTSKMAMQPAIPHPFHVGTVTESVVLSEILFVLMAKIFIKRQWLQICQWIYIFLYLFIHCF